MVKKTGSKQLNSVVYGGDFLNCFIRAYSQERTMQKSFQEYYEGYYNHCYGCGQLNEHGLKIKSYWHDDETTICNFMPKFYHTAFPGFVYGGLIASVIDCHALGSAAAISYKKENRSIGSIPKIRFVTASLKVDYLRPTPIEEEMTLLGKFEEVKSRRVTVNIDLKSKDSICARGIVVAVRISDDKFKK